MLQDYTVKQICGQRHSLEEGIKSFEFQALLSHHFNRSVTYKTGVVQAIKMKSRFLQLLEDQ